MAEDNPLLPKLEQISQATEQAANLTGQLLAFSRKQILQPTIVNLNDLVQNLQSMLAVLSAKTLPSPPCSSQTCGRLGLIRARLNK
ncbi:MAG: hypothetical protein IPK53_03890 [bacterium]|nr:hypothetical protein [bacterium]